MYRFHLPDVSDGVIGELRADQAHHLLRVLRLKPGDRIVVFDGIGHEALGEVASIAEGGVSVRVLEARPPAREPVVRITLAQAMLKGDKLEQVMRDAVMLGVAAIQPLVTERTDVPRAAVQRDGRRARWERTVLSSVQQCGRAVLPPVHRALEFGEWLSSVEASREPALMLVEPRTPGGTSVHELDRDPPRTAHLAVGPEGGWTAGEIARAQAAGVRLLTLGALTLRADAAASVAMAILRYAWRDL